MKLQKFNATFILAHGNSYLNGPEGKGAIRRPELAGVLETREKTSLEIGANLFEQMAVLVGNTDEESIKEIARLGIEISNIRQAVYAATDPLFLTAEEEEEEEEEVLTPSGPPAKYPNAVISPNDGEYYIPDPDRAGKFKKVTGI